MKPNKQDTEIDWLPATLHVRKRRFDRLTLILLVTLGAAAASVMFIRVDQVVTATGQIVPSDKVKVIQHLEGGIVKALPVREGDIVMPGAPLIELDLATAGMNIREISARRAALTFTRDRLAAESQGRPLQLNAALVAAYPALADVERTTFDARTREHTGSLAVFDSQAAGERSKLAELQVRLHNAQIRRETSSQEFQIASDLYQERLISQLEFIDRRKAVESVKADIGSLTEAVEGAKSAVQAALAKRAEEEGRYRRKSADELSQTERLLSSAFEEGQRAENQRERAIIRSPIEGIVKNLRLQAVGNVVKQGEPIMEIVPANEAILVEAHLSPSDRGYLATGEAATVKVSAYDFLRYGALEGTVRQIAADTNREANEPPYYKVIVATSRTYLGESDKPLRVSPGMQADVDIHIGSQPFIWYLIKPVLKLRHEAFREP